MFSEDDKNELKELLGEVRLKTKSEVENKISSEKKENKISSEKKKRMMSRTFKERKDLTEFKTLLEASEYVSEIRTGVRNFYYLLTWMEKS